jgi:signal peptidase
MTLLLLKLSNGETYSTYTIVSGSMEPAIKRGAIVITKKTLPEEIGPGDIIAFEFPNNPKEIIVHRVTALSGGEYITKGDANDSNDNWNLIYSDVKGKQLITIPYLGIIASKLRTTIGFAILIGIPALMLLALQLKKIYEGIEEEIQKRTQKELQKFSKRPEMVDSII